MPSIRPGDMIFDRVGRPAVVTKLDQEKDQIVLERQGQNFDKARAKGILNGLTVEDRSEFDEVMAEVRADGDPKKRIQAINERLEELRSDPKKFMIVRYLEGEMSHIMNTEKLHPRQYRVDIDSIRD